MNTWTKYEDDIMKSHYSMESQKQILKLLFRRTWSSIRRRACRLGIRRDTSIRRFQSRFFQASNGCWLWQGRLDKNGYGDFDWGGKTNKAHIYAFRTFVGDISEGKELDHLCRNRSCVNPEHLEPVTHLENVRRGQRAQQTSCQNGHRYTQETLYINKTSGSRVCRICRAEYN